MKSEEIFLSHLNSFATKHRFEYDFDEPKTLSGLLKLSLSNGYVTGSRYAAFFAVVFLELRAHPVVGKEPKKVLVKYALAIAQVFSDVQHCRATSVATALSTAFAQRGLPYNTTFHTVLKLAPIYISAAK